MKYYQVMIIYRDEKYICGLACEEISLDEVCNSIEYALANMSLTDRNAGAIIKEVSEKEYKELMPLRTGIKIIKKIDKSVKIRQFSDRAKIYGYSPVYTMIHIVAIKLGMEDMI